MVVVQPPSGEKQTVVGELLSTRSVALAVDAASARTNMPMNTVNLVLTFDYLQAVPAIDFTQSTINHLGFQINSAACSARTERQATIVCQEKQRGHIPPPAPVIIDNPSRHLPRGQGGIGHYVAHPRDHLARVARHLANHPPSLAPTPGLMMKVEHVGPEARLRRVNQGTARRGPAQIDFNVLALKGFEGFPSIINFM